MIEQHKPSAAVAPLHRLEPPPEEPIDVGRYANALRRSKLLIASIVVVVTGLVLGTAIAAATVIPVAKAVTGSFQPHTPPPYIAAIVVMAGVIGLAGTLLPTIARLRSRPVDAIGTRE